MRFKITAATVAEPFFLGSRNFGQKLGGTTHQDLHMIYDDEKEFLFVTHGDHHKMVPKSALHSMSPDDAEKAGFDAVKPKEAPKPPPAPKTPIKAQVSAPPGIKI